MRIVEDRYGLGSEIRCEPGEPVFPTACQRHPDHYWCTTCAGFYGVPHDGIHKGRHKHPYGPGCDQCVCRVCVDHRAELAKRTNR